MKTLRTILALIYVVLVLLLLLPFARTYLNGRLPQQPAQQPEAPRADEVRRARQTGGDGDLKVTLLWDFPADIDLHVVQPSGRRIFYQAKRDTSTGGFLDVDNRQGGRGAAENIYWQHPPRGRYTVSLVYFETCGEVPAVGTCTVIVFRKGQAAQTYRVVMTSKGGQKNVVSFTL